MKKYIFGLALLLATPAFAQQPGQPPQQEQTPEQFAVTFIQQQRNQALAKADDQAASVAYLQRMMALERRYWADYVKGLYPASQPEKKADTPPKK